VVPAQGTEGASDPSLSLNSFFVAPNMWTKFRIRHPDVSYSEFLSYHVQCYQVRNEFAKRFFAEFSKIWSVVMRFLGSAPLVDRRSVVR
jgi:hypothetical protein